ncbi:unnamed protein product [Blepharisma stoltei]|uniref:PAS domain-containing protein n=1 Tax=Blepharisma stoltei TaxID=1481888 RepID=A0AAU9J0R7_9CILI|nr:unnamed protein product [Blepharisma stoltei]
MLHTTKEVADHEDVSGFLEKSLFSNKLKNTVFGFFGQLFEVKYSTKIRIKQQLLYEITINIIITLQLTSLTWYPNLEVEDWKSYIIFWQGIGIISYDQVCATFGVMDFCFYGTISLIGACVLSFATFGTYVYLGKKAPELVIIIPRKIALMLSTVCLIPSSMICLMITKYSLINANYIEEYDGKTSSGSLNYGIYGAVFALFCIIILFPIILLSEAFTCDIKHSHARKNIKARSSAELDIQRRCFYMFMSVLYVSFGSKHTIIHQIIALVFALYLLYKCNVYMQFYNYLENSIQACKMASISSTLIVFIFGQIMNNALIIVIFNLFVQPLMMLFCVHIVIVNYKKLQHNQKISENQFEFECKIRHLLTDKKLEDKLSVLKLFKKYSKCSHFQKNKLFVIWEFNFCLSILKNERLARIKLSKIGHFESSFEGDIQEWRVFCWLVQRKCHSFPDTIYLEYLKEFAIIKRQDERLCDFLIELQEEFSLKIPRVRKLEFIVGKACCSIENVNKGYKNLIEKYKNVEAYENYISFLQNIMSNHEDADKINKKKNGLEVTIQRNENQNLENYGKNLAIILVTCADNSFGKIVYINDKAMNILGITLNHALDSPIWNFIPQPYDQLHEKWMKNFLHSSNTIEVYNDWLFLQDYKGFLIECNIMIKATAFHNSAYYLISFEQVAAKREMALITELGIIIGHTEHFSSTILHSEANLKCKHILKFLPGFDMQKANEPINLKIKDQDRLIVYIQKMLKSTKLHIIFIINDEAEIKKIKENDNKQQIFHSETNEFENKNFEMIKFQYQFDKIFDGNKRSYLNESSTLDLSPALNENSFYGDASSSTFSILKIKQSQDLALQTKKKLRILQLIFFLLIISAISSMAAILVYVTSDIPLSTSPTIFTHLGELLYDLGLLADFSSALDIEIQANSQSLDTQKLENTILSLINIQNSIISDFDDRKYCSAYDIATDHKIPLWNFEEKKPKISDENIYNMIGEFIYHGQNMISDVKSNKGNYKEHAKFLVINGLGLAYKYTENAIKDIEECEIDKIKMIGLNVVLFLTAGVIATSIWVGVIFWFIVLMSRNYDKFWNFLLNNAQFSLLLLKSAVIDRLLTIHGIEYKNDENISRNFYKIKRRVATKIYIKYTIRLLIFFAITLNYYLLVQLYLYPICETSLINRPKLLNNFNLRRSLLSRVSIFAREKSSFYLKETFPTIYDFADPKIMLNKTAASLFDKNDELRQKEFSNLMSKELRDEIYEQIKGTSMLSFGSFTSIEIAKYDLYDIANKNYVSKEEMEELSYHITCIENQINLEYQMANHDSKSIIDSQVNVIIYASVFYSVALLVLFCFYYFPSINSEIKQLNLYSILPSILQIGSDL